MASAISALAASLVSVMNNGLSNSQPRSVRGAWLPFHDLDGNLSESNALVSVVPSGRSITNASRTTQDHRLEIKVVIAKVVAKPNDAAVDSLDALTEEVILLLKDRKQIKISEGACAFESVENEPAVDERKLEEMHCFFSVVTATYRLIRA